MDSSSLCGGDSTSTPSELRVERELVLEAKIPGGIVINRMKPGYFQAMGNGGGKGHISLSDIVSGQLTGRIHWPAVG